jgi:DNA-binding transcriptional MerR regulator
MVGAVLNIGQLARLAGLTTKALRHYDRIGLLRPAVVDPVTNYRRYAHTQLETARLIRRLRDVDLPLDEIAAVLADPPTMPATLARHRRRVEARMIRLRGVLHELDHAAGNADHTHHTDEDTMTTETGPTADIAADASKRLAKQLFNEVWTLMSTEDRTSDDDALMIHKAHASLYHWLQAGNAANNARGEWQCSRVYAVLRRPEPAIYHAGRVLEICRRNGIGDWDLAFAYEALARAHAVAGDMDESGRHLELARAAGDDIAEDDDRELLLSDLETIPR